MRERLAAGRPGVSPSRMVDVDDQLPDHHSVGEGYDAKVPFEPAVCHEPRDQAPVNISYIADRIPDRCAVAPDFDFLVDGSHAVLPESSPRRQTDPGWGPHQGTD